LQHMLKYRCGMSVQERAEPEDVTFHITCPSDRRSSLTRDLIHMYRNMCSAMILNFEKDAVPPTTMIRVQTGARISFQVRKKPPYLISGCLTISILVKSPRAHTYITYKSTSCDDIRTHGLPHEEIFRLVAAISHVSLPHP